MSAKYDFEGQYKERLKEYTEELESNASELSREERMQIVDELTSEYIEQTGRVPDPAVLERLANVVLHEELTDKRADKMTLEEYPIMSDHQYGRRTTGSQRARNKAGVVNYEVPLEQGVNVATDGIDYTPHKRTFSNSPR